MTKMAFVRTTASKGLLLTSFYETPDDIKEYIKTTYTDTGKVTEVIDVALDGHGKKTKELIFKDDAAKAEYFADPILRANAEKRKAWHAENGIIDIPLD